MRKTAPAALAIALLVSTSTPSFAFWLEQDPSDSWNFVIHCKNREDFETHNKRNDAIVTARILCNEPNGHHEAGATYRAGLFSHYDDEDQN